MLRNRLKQLSRLLNDHADLWRQRPFIQPTVPWETDWPKLSSALRNLSDEEVLGYESDPAAIPGVRDAVPKLIAKLESLTRWPQLLSDPGVVSATAETLPRPKRVPLRKWNQIRHFVAAVHAEPDPRVRRWVDWCAGKGHLGRALHRIRSEPVQCVEIKAALCEIGVREAALAGISLEFECGDVLDAQIHRLLGTDTGAAALHACGYLNLALIEAAVTHQTPFLAIAPCCYQRIDGMRHTPISAAGAKDNVVLTRHQLRLPSLDETMTSEKRRAARRREHAFRLGTDLLIRRAAGIDRYTPLGPVKRRWLKQDFAHFARSVTDAKNLPLPSRVDWRRAEADGWKRFYEASALGMARGLFRRAIESWLVLDRALFLEENGYAVTIGTFCPPELTPRNLMITARLNR